MKTLLRIRRSLLRRAWLVRGRALITRWQRLVDHFGNGDVAAAERFYHRLVLYRRAARYCAFRAGRVS